MSIRQQKRQHYTSAQCRSEIWSPKPWSTIKSTPQWHTAVGLPSQTLNIFEHLAATSVTENNLPCYLWNITWEHGESTNMIKHGDSWSLVKTHAHLNAPVPHRTFLSPDAILHISRHGGYTNLAGQGNMARITSTPLRCSLKLPKSFTVSKSLAYTSPIHYLRT